MHLDVDNILYRKQIGFCSHYNMRAFNSKIILFQRWPLEWLIFSKPFLATERVYNTLPIHLGNILVVLSLSLVLLSIVGGSVPSAAGQNTFLNITTSDIVDLAGNVTERGVGEDDSSFPLLSDDNDNEDDNNNISSTNTGSSGASTLPPSSPSSSSSSSTVTTNQTVMINEIELNPTGEYDEGKEWIELYNPTDSDINVSNFEIRTFSESATIKLPPDVIIGAGETYVIELKEQILSNTVDSLVLENAAGDIQDRTPSLVDRMDDDRTWQRIPDGNNEWQFVEGTKGNLNDDNGDGDVPDTLSTILNNAENTPDNFNGDENNNDHFDTLSTILDSVYSRSDVQCLGSAGCVEGVVTRIVDGDTLYVEVNSSSTIYEVDLALTKAPSRNEEGFPDATAFTRDLCLGSTVLVDQDDKLLTSADSNIIGVVYCSLSNLNNQ